MCYFLCLECPPCISVCGWLLFILNVPALCHLLQEAFPDCSPTLTCKPSDVPGPL